MARPNEDSQKLRCLSISGDQSGYGTQVALTRQENGRPIRNMLCQICQEGQGVYGRCDLLFPCTSCRGRSTLKASTSGTSCIRHIAMVVAPLNRTLSEIIRRPVFNRRRAPNLAELALVELARRSIDLASLLGENAIAYTPAPVLEREAVLALDKALTYAGNRITQDILSISWDNQFNGHEAWAMATAVDVRRHFGAKLKCSHDFDQEPGQPAEANSGFKSYTFETMYGSVTGYSPSTFVYDPYGRILWLNSQNGDPSGEHAEDLYYAEEEQSLW